MVSSCTVHEPHAVRQGVDDLLLILREPVAQYQQPVDDRTDSQEGHQDQYPHVPIEGGEQTGPAGRFHRAHHDHDPFALVQPGRVADVLPSVGQDGQKGDGHIGGTVGEQLQHTAGHIVGRADNVLLRHYQLVGEVELFHQKLEQLEGNARPDCGDTQRCASQPASQFLHFTLLHLRTRVHLQLVVLRRLITIPFDRCNTLSIHTELSGGHYYHHHHRQGHSNRRRHAVTPSLRIAMILVGPSLGTTQRVTSCARLNKTHHHHHHHRESVHPGEGYTFSQRVPVRV
uniref:Uncharacterized protein n=1 Tax=Anopheles coluzzii TaxID=1518534 RepID=A0A8W7PIY2_ANOCL